MSPFNLYFDNGLETGARFVFRTDRGTRRFLRCGKLKARYRNGLAGRGPVCAESGMDFGQVPHRFDDIVTSDNVYYVNIQPGKEELFIPPDWSTSLHHHNPISHANPHSFITSCSIVSSTVWRKEPGTAYFTKPDSRCMFSCS